MNIAQAIVCGGLRLYRAVVSPLLHTLVGPGWGCRFSPTCSEYALLAVRRHGVGRGGRLALQRVCRCHPWGGAGLDPVPLEREPERELKPGPAPIAKS